MLPPLPRPFSVWNSPKSSCQTFIFKVWLHGLRLTYFILKIIITTDYFQVQYLFILTYYIIEGFISLFILNKLEI